MRTWLRRAVAEYTQTGARARSATASSETIPELSVRRLGAFYELRLPLLPSSLHDVVMPLSPDAETQAFLDSCRPNWCVSMLARLLRHFMSVTDVNALLRRGGMFVLSHAHARQLLRVDDDDAPPPLERIDARAAEVEPLRAGESVPSHATAPSLRRDGPVFESLLDVGAGDGGVTTRLAPLFHSVTVTEVSHFMARRLREHGWRCIETPYLTPDVFPTPGRFDTVSVFNVLDRCDHPADMLRHARRLMRPSTGRLVLAVVLPFSEFVEDGRARRAPHGPLPMRGARCQDGATFEASLAALVTRVLLPLGFDVERIAKVPYLCSGDAHRPYYVLSDAILVLRDAGRPEAPLGDADGHEAQSGGARGSEVVQADLEPAVMKPNVVWRRA